MFGKKSEHEMICFLYLSMLFNVNDVVIAVTVVVVVLLLFVVVAI